MCGDHPRRAFGGLYHCAKFGWNRCSSFDNMHFFRFREFGLKTPIHTPKLGVLGGKCGKGWGDIDPQRTLSYFWGFTRLYPIWWKSTKKCDRESVHRRTDTHTHARTDRRKTILLSVPCYNAIAMGQITKSIDDICILVHGQATRPYSDMDKHLDFFNGMWPPRMPISQLTFRK